MKVLFYSSLIAHHSIHLDLRRGINELAWVEEAPDFLLKHGQWMPVRDALNAIDYQQFEMLSRGLSIIQWGKHHQFCGRCVKATTVTLQSFERYCAACHIHYNPRISPAIIVLIRQFKP